VKRLLTAASLIMFAASCTSDVLIEDPPSPSESATPAATQPVTNYASLVEAMDGAGLVVGTRGGPGLKQLLGVPGHRLVVGGAMYAHEYPSEQALSDFQDSVSPDGGSIPTSDGNGTLFVEWAPPRFYSKGRLLVLYFGNNRSTLDALDRLLGPPFAGE
jgi:hypothetical protein